MALLFVLDTTLLHNSFLYIPLKFQRNRVVSQKMSKSLILLLQILFLLCHIFFKVLLEAFSKSWIAVMNLSEKYSVFCFSCKKVKKWVTTLLRWTDEMFDDGSLMDQDNLRKFGTMWKTVWRIFTVANYRAITKLVQTSTPYSQYCVGAVHCSNLYIESRRKNHQPPHQSSRSIWL